MNLSDVDKRILSILEDKENSNNISTYRLAKDADISWATAITHCYKLKSYGMIEGKPEKSKFGDKEMMVWWTLSKK